MIQQRHEAATCLCGSFHRLGSRTSDARGEGGRYVELQPRREVVQQGRQSLSKLSGAIFGDEFYRFDVGDDWRMEVTDESCLKLFLITISITRCLESKVQLGLRGPKEFEKATGLKLHS